MNASRLPKLIGGVIVSLTLTLAAPAQAAFDNCLALFPQRHVPQLPKSYTHPTRPLCFDGFAILYSGVSKTPIYAVERLNRQHFQNPAKRDRSRSPFYEEARLPSAERSRLADYKATLPDGQRMDRGHVVPAGDMTTVNAFAQSFSLANMMPQVPQVNQGPWNQIEKSTRKYIERAQGDVYVITGPVFGHNPKRLGPGKVWVPDAMFKLVYDVKTDRAWAHWLPNVKGSKMQAPISYAELTRRLGYPLLRNNPDD
jgi:endonuclease G